MNSKIRLLIDRMGCVYVQCYFSRLSSPSPTYGGQIKLFDQQKEMRDSAEKNAPEQLNKFAKRAPGKELYFFLGAYTP
jgi:hypothetical protein